MPQKNLISAVAVLAVFAIASAAALPSACYHFDDPPGTTAVDACNGHNGTVHPGVSWVSGVCGGAVAFDGMAGHVSVPNGQGLDGMTEMAIEAWIYLTAYPQQGRPIQIAGIWGAGSVDDDAWQLSITPDGHLMLEVSDGNPGGLPGDDYISERFSANPIPLNHWVHVCATFAPDSVYPYDPIRLYVDFQDNSGDYYAGTGQRTQFVQDTTQELWMGRNEAGHHIEAVIDELILYDTAAAPTPDFPLAIYDFEGPCGEPVLDLTGLGHDLISYNCAGFATRQDGLGQAASFDGVDDRYAAADALDLHNLDWLIIEAWVFPISPIAGKNLGIVTKWGPGPAEDDCFFLVYDTDGRLWGAIQGSARVDVYATDPLPLLAWSHVRMIYTGSTLSLYVNSVLVGCASATAGPLSPATTPLYIGRNDFDAQSPGTFWGYIDDVAIYGVSAPPMAGVAPVAESHITLEVLPTPVNGSASIRFELPMASEVAVEVYDLQGRLIRSLPEGRRTSGIHQVSWDGRDQDGHPAGSGFYLVRLRGPQGVLGSKRIAKLQ